MKSNIQHMLEKAGFTGVATMLCGIPFFGFGQSGWNIPMTQVEVPIEIMTLGVGTLNSFVTDGIHSFFNLAVPLGQKSKDRTAFITNAVVSGASFFACLHLAGFNVPYQFTLLRAFACGAVGEVVGTSVYEYLTNNLYL